MRSARKYTGTPVGATILGNFNPYRIFRQRIGLVGAAGWVTGTFAIAQVLRLGTNMVLARLLAPELLGTMVLINSLRTGAELLSDLGIGQSIVNNPEGEDPTFYSTAWTVQVIRGFVLFAVGLVATAPLAALYGNRQLFWLVPIVSSLFVINGFVSPAAPILQKRLNLRRLSIFNTATNVATSFINIVLAIITRTIWALIGGLLISGAVSVIGSFFLLNLRSLKFRLDRRACKSILHFGKWIFASSLIYFFAANFDRLYFAKAVPLAVLGVYGIARTVADAVVLFAQRLGTFVIFPKISSSALPASDLRRTILPVRRVALLVLAGGLACSVALADRFIFLAYDSRYRAAAVFLPLMLIGSWFSILASFADAMLMGIGKPANVAYANAAKLLTIVVAVPMALLHGGMILAVCVFAVAEAIRYAVLLLQKRAAGLAFSWQDVWMTVAFVLLIIVWREVFFMLGLTGGVDSWANQLRAALP